MKQIKIILSGMFMLMGAVLLSGCDADSARTDIQRYIGGNRDTIEKAVGLKTTIENANPVFDSEEEADTQDPTAKQVNELIKSSLAGVFGDSKLTQANNVGSTPFIMKYIVKRRINQPDGETLHKVLIEADSRVKDDSMPNYYSARNTVEFSVYHDFGGRSYILAVVFDLAEQVIWVNVY